MAGNLLKEIRKQLHLTQSQLAGPDITRNLVSMIENGKAPLTPKTAAFFAEQMTALSQGKYTVRPNDLLTPGLFKARQEASELIDAFERYHDDLHFNMYLYLAKFSECFSRWPLAQEKVEAYTLIGEHFLARNQVEEAQLYLSRAFENALYLEDPSRAADTARLLALSAYRAARFASVILTVEGMKAYEHQIPSELLLEPFRYQVLSCIAIGDFEKAIDGLTYMEHCSPPEEIRWFQWIQLTKAQCYVGKGMYGIASRILKHLIEQWNPNESHLHHLPAIIACLQMRINPERMDANYLTDLWNLENQASRWDEDSNRLFIPFMETAVEANALDLTLQILWQGINLLPWPQEAVDLRRLMELALTFWQKNPSAPFDNHWLHYLNRFSEGASRQDYLVAIQFLSFFQTRGMNSLTEKTLEILNKTNFDSKP